MTKNSHANETKWNKKKKAYPVAFGKCASVPFFHLRRHCHRRFRYRRHRSFRTSILMILRRCDKPWYSNRLFRFIKYLMIKIFNKIHINTYVFIHRSCVVDTFEQKILFFFFLSAYLSDRE